MLNARKAPSTATNLFSSTIIQQFDLGISYSPKVASPLEASPSSIRSVGSSRGTYGNLEEASLLRVSETIVDYYEQLFGIVEMFMKDQKTKYDLAGVA